MVFRRLWTLALIGVLGWGQVARAAPLAARGIGQRSRASVRHDAPHAGPNTARPAADRDPASVCEPEPEPDPEPEPEPEPPAAAADPCRGKGWSCCVGEHRPCIRARPARLLLAAVGLLMAGSGLSLLLVGRERWAARDPAAVFIGAGGIALAGATVGAFAGLTMGDAPAHADRLRPSTVGLELTLGDEAVLQERHPPSGAVRFAPTYFFRDGGGRIRLTGAIGGLLGEEKDVDPRPQAAGQFPTGLTERRLSIDLGLDLAVALPYPVGSNRRSHFLGPVELRYKPEVQIRRHWYESGSGNERRLERTMLLPLTAGFRWHLGPRQRFTFYLGPRFDFIAFSQDGGGDLSRGEPHIAPFYGEAWYDIDVPFNVLAARHRLDRIELNGMLRMGYVHSKFDGLGFNIGGAIGFAGPLQVAWFMRLRPKGSRYAVQAGIGTWIGNGITPFLRLGLVLPRWGRLRRPWTQDPGGSA